MGWQWPTNRQPGLRCEDVARGILEGSRRERITPISIVGMELDLERAKHWQLFGFRCYTEAIKPASLETRRRVYYVV